MTDDRSGLQKIIDNLAIIVAIILVMLGLYTYRPYLRENAIISLILLLTSTFSMSIIFGIWRKFTVNYAPGIIYWTTQHRWARKIVAGGSFSYYEFKENFFKIGWFEPVSRFLSMMIAFIGLTSSLAKGFGLDASSPVESLESAVIWSLLIVLIPIILTPIVPIIWAMEDLQLRSWNEKFKTNIRVSSKYKARFNSFIAVGTLGVAFGLTRDPSQSLQENFVLFLNLLEVALTILIYPIAVLTLLYYLYFRGNVIRRIRDKMNIPMAETKLIYRNSKGQILNSQGSIVAQTPKSEEELILSSLEVDDGVEDVEMGQGKILDHQNTKDKEQESLEKAEDQSIVAKTGDTVVGTGKAIIEGMGNVGRSIKENTIGKIFQSKSEEDVNPSEATTNSDNTESETSGEYKFKGGSATAGLWDDDKTKKKKS